MSKKTKVTNSEKNSDLEAINSFGASVIEAIGNENAVIAADGLLGDAPYFVDTGSYTLNALLSGTIYGGLPFSRITGFAGEEATGKTFFILSIIKNFLQNDPKACVMFFESENALNLNALEERGIDTKRVFVVPVDTVEGFKTQSLKALDVYMNMENKMPLMFVLDSLGMLSTVKEMEDSLEGKQTRDMTRSQAIRGTFRTLTSKLGVAGVPLLITNHTYQVIGSYIPTKEMGGGGGLKYAASSIVTLTKRKDKDGSDAKVVTGVIITATIKKGRLTRENARVEVRLSYDKGLDRYYGLLELAERYNIVKRVSTKVEFPDGTKAFEKAVYKNPTKYFTKEMLDKIDAGVQTEFRYGFSDVDDDVPEYDTDEE